MSNAYPDKHLKLFSLTSNTAIAEKIAKVVGGGAVPARAPFPASAPYGYDELNKSYWKQSFLIRNRRAFWK